MKSQTGISVADKLVWHFLRDRKCNDVYAYVIQQIGIDFLKNGK